MAQSVKCLALDFNSGHDLMVCVMEPCNGLCPDSTEPAWDFLSLLLSAPPLLSLCLSLKINKYLNEIRRNDFSL